MKPLIIAAESMKDRHISQRLRNQSTPFDLHTPESATSKRIVKAAQRKVFNTTNVQRIRQQQLSEHTCQD
ncbi:hypothetical protein BJX66DRAFT_32279 [Aspergillus keveii]|uniref:Uncharacterized protein n=1 Tax=Aspergillus keveii TaxID=714993 RepID=A0ABR4FT08_9EURO